tara:strand:+ start:276 stop:674 length:399 start_codon:yes stop_codon:yes gene_type:complete
MRYIDLLNRCIEKLKTTLLKDMKDNEYKSYSEFCQSIKNNVDDIIFDIIFKYTPKNNYDNYELISILSSDYYLWNKEIKEIDMKENDVFLIDIIRNTIKSELSRSMYNWLFNDGYPELEEMFLEGTFYTIKN